MDLIWLIPLLPGLGAAVNGIVGIRFFSKRAAGLVACATMALALGLSLLAFVQLLGLPPDARVHDVVLFDWIPPTALATSGGAIGSLHIPWAFRLDPLSAMMILVVTGVGFLIHVYSTGYMHDEPRGGVARYFAYLNLFCFFMLTLVLGSNYLVMFVGWEGVGLCSYLLIGYWYEKKSASDAGKKAFITNRVGDWGFLLGVFLIFVTFGTFDFKDVALRASTMPIEAAHFGTLSLITLLLFVGATGKSAQIPLYVWLPDAMEGPTPVSALIHAATMVTAGVYMVGRNAQLFLHAPMTMEVVAIVGVLTALFAATIGLVQTDIKRVLAYSTVSQLGYMFVAMGVGAFAAGAFHLMTHAFFKALLFLCSGAVIHAMAGEQNMLKMGGLKKYMPITYWTMMIGTVAIAGIPPFAGFFSKDEILGKAFEHHRVIWAVATFAALLTAFYMFRLMSLTFFGSYRGPAWEHGHGGQEAGATRDGAARASSDGVARASSPAGHDAADHAGHGGHGAWHGPHEAPKSMSYVLVALAVGAVLAGFVGVPKALGGDNAIEAFLHPSFYPVQAAAAAGETAAAVPLAHPGAEFEAPAGQEAGATNTVVARASAEGVARTSADGVARASSDGVARASSPAEHGASSPAEPEAAGMSEAGELGLMALSVLVGLLGIAVAWRFYVRKPEIAAHLKARFAGTHRVLTNKYYVDELYGATVIAGTMASANGLWAFDRHVVDGAVNGSGWLTIFTSWFSGILDKYIVDGLVNLVGSVLQESSFVFRRLQTGLIQNYALLMLFGVFAFVSLYLLLAR